MATIETLDKRMNGFEDKLEDINGRFDLMDQKFDSILSKLDKTVATKTDLENLARSTADNFAEMDEKFETHTLHMDHRFDQMDDRFDKIENISIGGHERRIENLEDDVRTLKTKTGIK